MVSIEGAPSAGRMDEMAAYEIIHHTETLKPESWVVFMLVKGRLERASNLGKRGGFRSYAEAQKAVAKARACGASHV